MTKKIRILSELCLFASLMVSIIGIFGWSMGVDRPTDWGGKVTMKMATCICLTNIVVIIIFREFERLKRSCDVLSAVTVVYMLGLITGVPTIDELIFEDGSAPHSTAPGIPSYATAIFVFGACMAIEFKSLRTGFSALCIIASLTCMIGHAIDSDLMIYYVEDRSTAMAIPTAMCVNLIGTNMFLENFHEYSVTRRLLKIKRSRSSK